MHPLALRWIVLSVVAFTVSLVSLAFVPKAHAQSTPGERYTAAMEARRYADAADAMRELQRSAPQSQYQAALARALALASLPAQALVEARRCEHDVDLLVAHTCAAVVREVERMVALVPTVAVSQPSVSQLRNAAAPTSQPSAQPPRLTLTMQRSWVPTTGPIVLWSVGGASLVLVGILATLRDGALSGCVMRGDTAVCQDAAAIDRGRSAVGLTMGANGALAVGITALVAGTAWWLLDGRAVVPVVTPEGASLAYAGRW